MSLEYMLETESSTGSALLEQQSPPPTSSSPSPLNILSLPPPYTMSQYNINLEQVVQQQQEQLAALQAIITQARLGGTEGAAVFVQPNTQVEVVRLQEFDGSSGKVAGFIIAYKLYIYIKMRGVSVEEQIQWVLSYMQGRLVDIWKKNVLEDLKGVERTNIVIVCLQQRAGLV